MSQLPSYLREKHDSSSSESEDFEDDDVSLVSGASSDEEGGNLVAKVGGIYLLPETAQRLPASRRIDRIKEAIEKHRVVCVLGDTGCGKSTVIPFALANGVGDKPVRILCTQPRRMAAISLCDHVAKNFYGSVNSNACGYRVRGQKTDTEESQLIYVTAGYLKTMFTHEPDELGKYTHIILDEVHERGIESDFLSLIVKKLMLLPENVHIKLIVMSATLESNLFVEYFEDLNFGLRPPTVLLTAKSEGSNALSSGHKIEELFLEEIPHCLVPSCLSTFDQVHMEAIAQFGVLPGEFTDNMQNLTAELVFANAINNFTTLVFLPGLGEILSLQEKIQDLLEKKGQIVVPMDADILPENDHYYHIFILHSTMPYEEQKRALLTPLPNARHIVLSTNVAESSLTVPNVNLVIDSGLKRTNSYEPVNRVYRLTTVWCSRASCMQRRGRTGRVCSGTYIKLYPRKFFQTRMNDYDTPEVLLSDLSCVFLNAKYISEFWRLPDTGMKKLLRPSEILRELITPPKSKSVKAAIVDLFEAGILRHKPDEMSELSLLGTLATRLHVEPQIARILYYGWLMGMPCEGIVLAASCGMDTDIIKVATKYSPGNEEFFCKTIQNCMWYRTQYDLGSFSEPIAVRNLLLAWCANHYGVSSLGEIPKFYRQSVFAREFDNFKRLVVNHCVQFAQWIHDEIGDEEAETQAEMLKEIVLEQRKSAATTNSSMEEILSKIFSAGLNFDKLKSLLLIGMNTRLLTADAIGSAADFSGQFDPHCGLRFDKMSEQVFNNCESENEVFNRLSEIAAKLTGRIPEDILVMENASEQATTTTWILRPGKDGTDDLPLIPTAGNPYFGLVAPIAVRTCMQFYDRRFTCSLELPVGPGNRMVRQKIKAPKYSNNVSWGRLTGVGFSDTPEWLPITVNVKSPVGWLHKIPSELRNSGTDRYWSVAGKIVGTSKSVADQSLPTEARAHNVTILPVVNGGRVATLLLLAALPFRNGLVAEVAISDCGQCEVLRVQLESKFYIELNRCQLYPVTLKMLRSVAAVRSLIAKATDIPGTCIRRVDKAQKSHKQLAAEALRIVREVQNSATGSLADSLAGLIELGKSETVTSNELFAVGSDSPTTRKVQLIAGGGYGEMMLDPTIWQDPDDEGLGDSLSYHVRKDQILKLTKIVAQDDICWSDIQREELPVIRLSVLGFTANEIAEYLEKKPKYDHSKWSIETIMEEGNDTHGNGQWLLDTRRAVDETLTEEEALLIVQEEPARRVVPPMLPSGLHRPQDFTRIIHRVELPITSRSHRDEQYQEPQLKFIPPTPPPRAAAPVYVLTELEHVEFSNVQRVMQPVHAPRASSTSISETQMLLLQMWEEVLSEATHLTYGNEVPTMDKLVNIWNRIDSS